MSTVLFMKILLHSQLLFVVAAYARLWPD